MKKAVALTGCVCNSGPAAKHPSSWEKHWWSDWEIA